jgi:hypothetical protein
MAHHKQFRVTPLHGLPIELECPLVEPSRPWFRIVFERKPEMFELLNLQIMGAPEIYDVGYTDSLNLLYVGLGRDCASKREPSAHEEGLHRLALGRIPNRLRRLYNLYFTNAGFISFEPVKSITCGLTVRGDF